MPFVVDFKKGFELLTDLELWTIPDEEKDRKINVWWKGTNVNGKRAALEIRTRPG